MKHGRKDSNAGKAHMTYLALQQMLLQGMMAGGVFASCVATPIMWLHSKELAAKIPIAFAVYGMVGIAFSGGVMPASRAAILC